MLQSGLVLVLSTSVNWQRGKDRYPGGASLLPGRKQHGSAAGPDWAWMGLLILMFPDTQCKYWAKPQLHLCYITVVSLWNALSWPIYLLCICNKCRAVSEIRKILISSSYILIPGCLSLVTLKLLLVTLYVTQWLSSELTFPAPVCLNSYSCMS